MELQREWRHITGVLATSLFLFTHLPSIHHHISLHSWSRTVIKNDRWFLFSFKGKPGQLSFRGDEQWEQSVWQAYEVSANTMPHLIQVPPPISEPQTHAQLWFLRNGSISGIYAFVLIAEPNNFVWRFGVYNWWSRWLLMRQNSRRRPGQFALYNRFCFQTAASFCSIQITNCQEVLMDVVYAEVVHLPSSTLLILSFSFILNKIHQICWK